MKANIFSCRMKSAAALVTAFYSSFSSFSIFYPDGIYDSIVASHSICSIAT